MHYNNQWVTKFVCVCVWSLILSIFEQRSKIGQIKSDISADAPLSLINVENMHGTN